MSRTDKDRPYWVKNFQDGNTYDHDHRRGECIEETLELAKFYGGRSWGHHRHNRNCNKSQVIEVTCKRQKVDGRKTIVYSDQPSYRFGLRDRSKLSCWTWYCPCEPLDPYGSQGYHFVEDCADRYFVECMGHYFTRYDRSIPCECDDWPDHATCTRDEPYETRRARRYYVTGGVPTWFVRNVYHRPERARERGLNELAREYNTYGDIEDGDYFNRQGRNSARWDWW